MEYEIHPARIVTYREFFDRGRAALRFSLRRKEWYGNAGNQNVKHFMYSKTLVILLPI